MNRPMRRIGIARRGLLVAGIACSIFGMLSAPASAQTNVPANLQASVQTHTTTNSEGKLATRVNLTLGTTTLPQLLAALTAQTGLSIEAAPALQDRQITVQMQDVSARDALDALAELNEWTWRQLSTGVIRIARARPNLPQKAAAIRPLMRAAIPKDLRDFLGIGFSDQELRQRNNPERPHQDRGRALGDSTRLRISKAIQAEQTDLPTLLPSSLWQNDKVPYPKMPILAQQKLLWLLTLRLFGSQRLELLQEEIYPYGLEASEITIHMDQQHNRLEIGRRKEQSFAGIVVVLPPQKGE